MKNTKRIHAETDKIIGKKIKSARIDCDLDQLVLAERTKISRNKLWRIENGHTTAKSADLKKIAKVTGKPLSYFLPSEPLIHGRDLINAPIQSVPVISWVNANRFAASPIPQDVADTFVHTTGKGKNIFALKVRSDCMEPEFIDGDIIIVRPDINADNGDYVIVQDNDSDEATFKQLKRYGRKVILHPLNHKYSDIELDHDERYQIIGVVIEKVKKYR